MRHCLILSTLLLTALSGKEEAVLVHRLIVLPTSKLTIDGRTNVNQFQCATTYYTRRDTLVLIEGKARRPFFEKGYVGLEAASFDCGMQVLTADFGKTIKAEEHPAIFIEFISFERAPDYQQKEDKFKGKMKISLGGVTKTFQMDCSIKAQAGGQIHLRGGRDFTFSDFELKPPQKMMGLIKVEDAFKVNFHLILLLDRNA
ncbi:MAG: hypothetical protein ACOYXA_08670 [Bacteroidota bacterium]